MGRNQGGHMNIKKFIAYFLFVSFIIFPVSVPAAQGTNAKNAKLCLACHGDETYKKITKRLQDNTFLSLYINGSEFAASVHAKTGCTGCHRDISMDNHPVVKTIAGKRQYSAQQSRNCSICHTADELNRRLPIHSALAAQGTCVECHGSHYIRRMALEKTGVEENQYCMTCHRNRISMTMKNRETLSVHVDESVIKKSVHGKLKCTECHTGFSKTSHPVRSFDSLRDYSLINSEMCWKCHNDAYGLYEKSVHNEKLKAGDTTAPACTDCHGSHAVVSVKKDKSIGLSSCNKCHRDMSPSFEASIHGIALKMGNIDAPVCSSCHNAHDVESTATSTKIKDGCLKCHKDAADVHSKWLNNPPIALPTFAKAHFDVVSCAACHTVGGDRSIYLSLYNRRTEKPLSEEELMNLFGTDSEGLMAIMDTDGNGIIDAKELWNTFGQLFNKGVLSIFMGKMDVQTAEQAHMIVSKAEAVSDCEKCHHPEAEFFENISIVIKRDEGKPVLIDAQRDILNSVYSILPVSKFYAVGSTSIKLLDILFIVAVIGGLAVPIGHIAFRIITSPIRSLRRMGKGGKK
jgi:hypothetical protein